MQTKLLDYELPQELIAQHPSKERCGSRLLVLERAAAKLTDRRFSDISDYIRPKDCFVINDTKVLPARFYANRKTGAKLEGLFLEEKQTSVWLVMLKGAGKIKIAEDIVLNNRDGFQFCTAKVIEKLDEGLCLLKIESKESLENILSGIGFTPLPPYIKRSSNTGQDDVDRNRYQTVYANKSGAVAAPTAGLHFTDNLIEELKRKGVSFANVTLHVGAGTFKPVSAENLNDHQIHSEWFNIDSFNAQIINTAKKTGGRIIAVGTTSVRVLETAAASGEITASSGQTKLFTKPPYEFKMVDAMVTNFHLPRSTLLALVASFAGLEEILAAYK
ncbi:MAG: tRNA preQ1(34) S-adenosylmethionine ribosyltransferase-isomerase QueA, partial [Phycisphaerae bacterium]|nr:tRNA preQ1(34) S-adenosylmethionine ribosyltransferase-isomerase QueA [Phycisphaerae bacterium]